MGGEPVLRVVIDRFVDRVFADVIIGFLFAGRDRDRIARHEYEHTARLLGADVVYTGRPIPATHRPLRINAGQFRRRLAILRQELGRADVPADITALVIEAQERMLPQITDGTDCGAPDASGR
jgi:hemoglobin